MCSFLAFPLFIALAGQGKSIVSSNSFLITISLALALNIIVSSALGNLMASTMLDVSDFVIMTRVLLFI